MTKSSAVLPGVPLLLTATVPLAPLVVPVIAGVPSKLSLPSTRTLTGVSSFVVAVSPAMSATALIVTVTVAVSVTPSDVTV